MKIKNLDYQSSEDIKISEGVDCFNKEDNQTEESSIQVSQRNVLSELSDEIRKTLRYYMKSKVGVSYNKFYISGGSAEMKGLNNFLNTSLNVDFVTLNPFYKNESKGSDDASKYAVSFGLALRKLEKE